MHMAHMAEIRPWHRCASFLTARAAHRISVEVLQERRCRDRPAKTRRTFSGANGLAATFGSYPLVKTIGCQTRGTPKMVPVLLVSVAEKGYPSGKGTVPMATAQGGYIHGSSSAILLFRALPENSTPF